MENAQCSEISSGSKDELAGSDTCGSTLVHSPGSVDLVSIDKHKQLQQLCQGYDETNPRTEDFEVANIAREELRKIVEKFDEDAKPSKWQQFGFSHKAKKVKTVEVLRKSMDGDISALKASVDSLETGWKENHGLVYGAFKKICNTLDNHRSILKVFPSQNDYASPLVGSVTILMKAAKPHTEISILLSKSVAEISDKVGRCSKIIVIITTPEARQKLAEIYARMFNFYQRILEWYLQSRFDRMIRSFNENLLKEFEDAKLELEDSIFELYREAAIANMAMTAMASGKMASLETEIRRQRRNYEAQDTQAGQRLQQMIYSTWSEVRQLSGIIERAISARAANIDVPSGRIENEPDHRVDDGFLQASASHLDAFIINNDGQKLFGTGLFWIADKETMVKLRTWTRESTTSRTLWITSPYEPGIAMPGSRAAATATTAAAWQAETPIISVICKRPRQSQLRSGMSIEQVGLISLVYDLIRQLLQFASVTDKLTEVKEEDLESMDGETPTWVTALRILEVLLKKVPEVTFCVIDGLNEFEWGNGGPWCKQFVAVLQEKQQQTEGAFNILFSTTGQSYVLPKCIKTADRHQASKRATRVSKAGAFR